MQIRTAYVLTFIILLCTISYGQDTLAIYKKTSDYDKMLGLNLTYRDFVVDYVSTNDRSRLFANSNLSLGVHLKYKKFETVLTLPFFDLGTNIPNAPKIFGTSVSLNYFNKQFHIYSDTKLVFAYESTNEIITSNLEIFDRRSAFLSSTLNLHYVLNNEAFSLHSTIRFGDDQIRTGSSWIIGIPILIQYINGDDLQFGAEGLAVNELLNFNRSGIGFELGYGINYIKGSWHFGMFSKAGFLIRRQESRWLVGQLIENNFELLPRLNLTGSIKYAVKVNYIGILAEHIPISELNRSSFLGTRHIKLRLQVGRRF